MSTNIPARTCCKSISLEVFGIVRFTVTINDFITRAFDLFWAMIAKGGNRAKTTKHPKKIFHCYPKFLKSLVKHMIK